jgi:Gram-negative bacterial TonB protein C-terminal
MSRGRHFTPPSPSPGSPVRFASPGGRSRLAAPATSGRAWDAKPRSRAGAVGNVEVLESSDQRLEAQAAASLSSWPFEPGTRGGEPAAVEDAEAVMTFYTDDTTTTGEVIGATLLIIVLVPLAVVLGAASKGSMTWGK